MSDPDNRTKRPETKKTLSKTIWGAVGESMELRRQAPPLGRVDRAMALPLSLAQQRLWFIQQTDPAAVTYNVNLTWRISGLLNVSALEQSFNAVVRRHENFRTTFVIQDGQPVQIISSAQPLDMVRVDLQAFPPAEREARLCQQLAHESRRPFDLAKGPLLRTALFQLAEEEQVLLLSMHHIVCDGSSLGVLYRELETFYRAFGARQPLSLPELPIQYADFAVWQREWLRSSILERQLSYWRQQLGGELPVLELPTDRPRPPRQTFGGAQHHFTLPLELTRAIASFRKAEESTLFNILLAGFKALLYRYTSQEDLIVGSLTPNRQRNELRNLIGFMVNTQALRTQVSGDLSFRELLKRVSETVLGAYSNQDVRFDKLVEELRPDRHLSHTPLFQVLFSFQGLPRRDLELPGLRMQMREVDNGTSKFDLTLDIRETQKSLACRFEYNTDLFDAATITRLIGHFQNLLAAIVATPNEPLYRLPLLTKTERQQLLIEWNQTAADYPQELCVHQLVEAQAARTPDAVALEFEGRELTYLQLDTHANEVAHQLRNLGVGPDVLVGLCLERGLEMVIGVLGVLKAGGAYVPLDPALPRERLAFMLEDARPLVLLTQQELLQGLPPHSSQVLALDAPEWRLSKATPIPDTPHAAGRNPHPDNLAYVIYTSGSTGRPKGVQIPHRAVVNFLNSMRQVPGLSSHDTVLALTTLSFDIAGLELLLPLTVGAKVVIVRKELATDGRQLARQLAQCGATLMQATPATWQLLLDAEWAGAPQLKILCGGEAWPKALAQSLLGRCHSLWNMYGPTETTVYSAACRITAGDEVLIGPPIANTQFYILDAHLQPAPVGVPGELHIGGDGLARGYLNRPELTAEKFISNPFSERPGARLYKTGDLARYRADGKIEFLARIDHQVKLRGYRIELGEIESVLARHPGVRTSVVLAREDTPGDKRLVAYAEVNLEQAPTIDGLRLFLKQHLPDYMIPSAFLLLEKLPLTPNGKVDRLALPSPDPGRPDLNECYVAPRNQAEQDIARIWQEVLSLERVGVKDDFFNLGGHSLLAVIIFARIKKLTGKDLPLATLFEGPTIEKLAFLLQTETVSQVGSAKPSKLIVPIQPHGTKPPFFCIHGAGGAVVEYSHLGRYLAPDQPFYGIQAQGLDGKEPWLKCVEEMAARYLTELQEVQPQGPYYLGGSSFGGLIAYELAQRLQAVGQRVALLALFDTHGKDYPRPLPVTNRFRRRLYHFVMRVDLHWGNLCMLQFKDRPAYIREKLGRLPLRWKRRMSALKQQVRWWFLPELLRNQFKWAGDTGGKIRRFHLPPAYARIGKANTKSQLTYQPKPYAGSALLFRATKQPLGVYPNPTNGWGDLIQGGLEVIDIPGYHGAIVREPRVKVLAKELKERLHQAQWAAQSQPRNKHGDSFSAISPAGPVEPFATAKKNSPV